MADLKSWLKWMLWASRLTVLLALFCSILMALAMLYLRAQKTTRKEGRL
jgi:hypothetical protein